MGVVISPFVVSGKIPEALFCDRVKESADLFKDDVAHIILSRQLVCLQAGRQLVCAVWQAYMECRGKVC